MSDNSILSVMIQSAANSPANPVYKKDLTPLISNLMDLNSAPAPYTPPYKVYTALLTQSGGDDPTFVEGDGELQVGRSYEININNNNIDFTPYGAPNNNIGTKFVCTVYFGWIDPTGIPGDTQLLYNTGAPVVTVLENTIGNVWFTYNAVGIYLINSNGLFTENKTTQSINSGLLVEEGCAIIQNINITSSLRTILTVTSSFDLTNDKLNNTPIEIRVYN